MLSQYSWGDFFKVIILVLVVYYTYVLIVYYREDIRDWISGRRGKAESQPASEETELEDETDTLYSVNQYGASSAEPEPVQVVADVPAVEPTPAVPKTDTSTVPPASTAKQSQSQPIQSTEPDLNGVALDEDESNSFSLPIQAEAQRPDEQSVAELIQAAQRLQATDEGVLIPDDPEDHVAANLAEVINQQQGKSALSGITFTR